MKTRTSNVIFVATVIIIRLVMDVAFVASIVLACEGKCIEAALVALAFVVMHAVMAAKSGVSACKRRDLIAAAQKILLED